MDGSDEPRLGNPSVAPIGTTWTGDREAYFWATHAGAELDLMLTLNGQRFGFTFKCADAPVLTKSMPIARHDLKLTHLFVVYPGRDSYGFRRRCTHRHPQLIQFVGVSTGSKYADDDEELL